MRDNFEVRYDDWATVRCQTCGWQSVVPGDSRLRRVQLLDVVMAAERHACPIDVGMAIAHASQLESAPVGTVVMAVGWDDDVEAERRWVWIRTHRSDEPLADQWSAAGDPCPELLASVGVDLTVLHVGGAS
ncbi:MAG: hypothetical protein FWH11_01455 [Micrococcales bacterium]|nr:hypothetical protein [Micrococcales bacterium]